MKKIIVTLAIVLSFNLGKAQVSADFTYSFTNNSQCAPTAATFNNTSGGAPPLTYKWTFKGGNPDTSTQKNPVVLYTSCGNDTVTLKTTDANSYVQTKTVIFTIACSPVAIYSASPLSGTPPLIVQFHNLSIAVLGTIDSCLWDFNDGTLIHTYKPNLDPPPVTYTQTGYYKVGLVVFSSFGCRDMTTMNNYIFASSLGVNDISLNSNEIFISPNPSSNYLNISLPSSSPISLYVTNLLGQEMYFANSQQLLANSFQINVTSFPNGIYFLHTQSGNEIKEAKFVVQH